MFKHLCVAMVAVCSMALGMPAASAGHQTVHCRFTALSSSADLNEYVGAAAGYIIGNPGETVTIQCVVRVDSIIEDSTPQGVGSTAATTAGDVSFTRRLDQVVQLCARYTTPHGPGETCFATTTTQFPPQEVIDLLPLGCDDGLDNDLDGYQDMADPGCESPFDTDERGTTACDDGLDNDGDGHSDHPADPGCGDPADGDELDFACDDGVDNDGDGKVDYPDDPGCASALDGNERGGACDDGDDDDGDGLADPADPGCSGPGDGSERDANFPCDDGVDNDGDGFTDYPADLGCRTVADPNETTIP